MQETDYGEQTRRNMDAWEELARREQADWNNLMNVLDTYADLFHANWRPWDGEGGKVIDELHKRFTPPRRRKTTYRRPSHGAVTGKKRTTVMERDKYRCVHCGTHERLTVDHITALANGGTSDLDNLQTLCASCNSRKGDR